MPKYSQGDVVDVEKVGAAIRSSRPVLGLAARSPVHELNRRQLGTGAVLAQSLGSIAPAAASSAAPAAAVAAGAGSGAVWSAVLALLVAALVAAAINVFTRRMAAPGSLYSFSAQGLGPLGGFLTGAALLVGYGGIGMACIAGATQYLGRVARFSADNGAVVGRTASSDSLLLGLAIVVVVGLIVHRGALRTWRLLLALEAVSVIAVLAASVTLLTSSGDHASLATILVVAPSTDSLGYAGLFGFVAGVIISASGFVGFESGTALGPEARRPFQMVPRVVRWAPLISGGVLVVSTWAQVDAFAVTAVDPAATTAPFHDLLAAQGYTGAWQRILDLAVGISFVACAVASLTALVRLTFAVGLEGMLPGFLARVDRRFRTPYVALGVALPVIAAVPLIGMALGVPMRAWIDSLIAIGVFGYMLAYLGVSVAAPLFLWRIGEATAGPVARAGFSAGILAGLVAAYVVYQDRAGNAACLLAVAAVLAAAVVYYARVNHTRPESVRAIGLYDVTSDEDVLWGPRADTGGNLQG
ncbi:amino acid transporter [Mycolicibacterium sp. BK634]|uniref:APC family permease n=1 Tax=Mycolicibacterium sp. BK634 TaxID=2587099 RepID=UPI001608B17C|nr:amino acid transporter [Mycolicibacterium sp. BK634]